MKKDLKARFSNVIIYQDLFEKESNSDKRVFHALAGECIDNSIYLYGIDNNSICKIYTDKGNMEIWYGDNDKPYCEEYLYIKSISYDHIICFISEKAEKVLKFDTNTGKKEWIPFDGNALDFEPALYEGLLFLLPMGYSKKLICIDIENNSVKYFPTNYESQLSRKYQRERYLFGKAILVKDCIYRGSFLEPCIQKYNIVTGQFEYIEIKKFSHPIKSMSFDGEYFWILSKKGTIIRWNEKDNIIIFRVDLAEETKKQEMQYTFCSYINGMVYILEKMGACILELDVKKEILLSYDCNQIPGFELKCNGGQAFAEQIRVDFEGAVYFFPFYANGVIVKAKNGSVYFYKTETARGLKIANEQPVHNESTSTLNYFCENVQKADENIMKQACTGAKILHNVLKFV